MGYDVQSMGNNSLKGRGEGAGQLQLQPSIATSEEALLRNEVPTGL